ncbi:MAG TPA: flagellar hook-associated protein FlgK [Terriglobia bacterium]|nr:flagellar hook-associated protein FlgK [Terriglobia bacterium]
MAGLFGSLSIALRSLMAQQGALQVASNNIANVNTPGYSRQRPVLEQEAPIGYGSLLFGNGVDLRQVRSIRDRILELRIYQETQQQARYSAYLAPAQQVEALFSLAATGSLQQALSGFFDSLRQLSVNPSGLAERQNVLNAANNLAAVFRRASGQLRQIAETLDQSVAQTVGAVNEITAQIAQLNNQISAAASAGQNPGTWEDQRHLLIEQLSGLIDVAVVDAGQGKLTLTTAKGSPLVVGDRAWPLDAPVDPSTGRVQVFSQGADITATLSGGRLGGLLEVRDQLIADVQSNLDDLAAALIQAFNAQHHAGFDRNGVAGGDFFVPFAPPVPGSNAGAAASFTVALSDPALVAASADGAPGDNGNLAALIAIQSQNIVAGQPPASFLASLVGRMGNEVARVRAEGEAESLALLQLQNLRDSVSGVSLDEEAANLIRLQRAFEAAARVVAVVDSLTEIAIHLGKE